MFDDFARTLVKLAVASLILGSGLAYFGVTADKLLGAVRPLAGAGDRACAPRHRPGRCRTSRSARIVIVPVWFVMYLFRPPRPRIGIDGRL